MYYRKFGSRIECSTKVTPTVKSSTFFPLHFIYRFTLFVYIIKGEDLSPFMYIRKLENHYQTLPIKNIRLN